jgi:hypothetical protein
MRLSRLLLVGIIAVGCKDPPAAKPPEPARSATPETGASAPTAQPQPRAEAPTLEADKVFDAETRDARWADSAEQTIEAVAPQLHDVSCRRMQCRATLTASTEAELMAAIDKLSEQDSLQGVDGLRSIKLTQPEQRDGKVAMRLFVQFNRD